MSSREVAGGRATIRAADGTRRLFLGERAFLVLGAELHNSSGTGVALERGLDRVRALNANTALVPVSWEIVEPAEGRFDFSSVDRLLDAARRRDLKIIPLWFGSWKNGQSSYVPGWVKTDPARFPRAVLATSGAVEHLSPFSDECRSADATAFAAFMTHLAENDEEHGTVIMVQVENEVGLLGDSRDRSVQAESRYRDDVPPAFLDVVRAHPELPIAELWRERGCPSVGDWEAIFGEDERTDEAFMAWGYARFVEHVAAVGRERLDLPLFTNTWLDSEIDLPGWALAGGQRPGVYPSGGPEIAVAAIWRSFAPSLALICPDIYLGDVAAICEAYRGANEGGLFIPEMRRDDVGAGHAFLAVGAHGALGVSPFGVDSEGDLAAMTDAFALLAQTASLVTTAPTSSVTGFHLSTADAEEMTVVVGSQLFAVTSTRPGEAAGYGLIIRTGDREFVGVGRGFRIRPLPDAGERIGILSVEELVSSDGGLEVARRLNGDETMAGSAWFHPALGPAAPGMLPIAAEGENSGITRCTLYRY